MSLLAQDERLARRVGAVVLCALVAAIGFVVFVLDRLDWGDKVRVRVYLRETGGVVEGAPLVVGGREVGEVERIASSPRGAPGPLGGDEGVVMTVAIDAEVARRLRRDADVFVASRGLLSTRYLELGPVPEDGPLLADGDELRGRDPPSLDRVLNRTWANLLVVKRFAEAVSPEVDRLEQALAELDATLGQVAPSVVGVSSLDLEVDALVTEARRTYDGLGGRDGLARVGALIEQTHTTVACARHVITQLRARGDELGAAVEALRVRAGAGGSEALAKVELAIERARAAIDRLEPLLARIDEVRVRIERGEGSLGRLMKDPEFPEDAKALGKIIKRNPWRVIARPKD